MKKVFIFIIITSINLINGCNFQNPKQMTGSLTITTYAFEGDLMKEIRLSDGIEFPWNYGWSAGVNCVPGLPFKFSNTVAGTEICITVDNGELILLEEGHVISYGKTLNLNSPENIYWRNINDGYIVNEKTYIDIILKNEEHITGYAVIELYLDTIQVKDYEPGTVYYAKVITNVEYPLIKNAFQNITEEFIKNEIQKNHN